MRYYSNSASCLFYVITRLCISVTMVRKTKRELKTSCEMVKFVIGITEASYLPWTKSQRNEDDDDDDDDDASLSYL